MDPNSPVVKLCAAGMKAESEGRPADAKSFFLQAWEARENPFDGCVAAHYVARHQATPEDGLHWNQRALDLADQAEAEAVRGFYASLYLNLGRSHELLGHGAEARRNYDLAAAHEADVPAGPYGDIVRSGIKAAFARMEGAMVFEVRLRGGLVGRSDRLQIDRAAGIGHGDFTPGPLYPLVEPVFRLFAKAHAESDPSARDHLLRRYAAERAALPFQLFGPDDRVWPTTSIHVADFRGPAGDGALELEVRFSDAL